MYWKRMIWEIRKKAKETGGIEIRTSVRDETMAVGATAQPHPDRVG